MEINAGRIIHVGEVDWFGGYSYKRNGINHFGFLVGGIHFSASALDSEKKDYYLENGLRNGPVLFSLKNEENVDRGAEWVKPVSEISEEELRKLYDENESFRTLMNDPKVYMPLVQLGNMGLLFTDVLQSAGLSKMIEAIKGKPALLSNSVEIFLKNIRGDELTPDDINDLYFTLLNTSDRTTLLKSTFPVWIEDAKVLNSLDASYFPKCIDTAIKSSDYTSMEKMINIASDSKIKTAIVSYLPLDRVLSNHDYCNFLSDEKVTELLRVYFDTKEIRIDSINGLLTIVEPGHFPNSAILLGEKMFEINLPISLWKTIASAEKVWFIIFLSLHLDSKNTWIKPLAEIYKYEHNIAEVKNYCVLAALEFLAIALTDQSRKQACFDKAHRYLEDAIVYDFDHIQRPSAELMQLIPRCKESPMRVCAVRYWKKQNKAWCSTRRNGCGCFSDNGQNSLDFSETNYVLQNDHGNSASLCHVSMADLLNNIGYTPDLQNVYNSVFEYSWGFEEYPYRIGGRILQLCRLFSHMHCRCGKLMKSDYGTSVRINAKMSITHAYCSDYSGANENEHDPDVYLNECWNCNEVIDSRESKYVQLRNGLYCGKDDPENKGYYVCMTCGAGYQNMLPSICPDCGCTEIDSLEFISVNQNPPKRKFSRCKQCGYSSRDWESAFESEKVSLIDETTLKRLYGFTSESEVYVLDDMVIDKIWLN